MQGSPREAARRVHTWTQLGRLDLVASTLAALQAWLCTHPVRDPDALLGVLDAAPEDLALPLLDVLDEAAK